MRWHAHMRRPGADERAAALPTDNSNGANGDGTAQRTGEDAEPTRLD